MKSRTTDRFWKSYDQLPVEVKRQVQEAYHLFEQDPYYPGLHFKRIHSSRPIFSARVSRTYRSVGIMQGDEIIWFWIGTHSEYDKLVKLVRAT